MCQKYDLSCAKVSFDVCLENKKMVNIRCLGDPLCSQQASELYMSDSLNSIDDIEGEQIT